MKKIIIILASVLIAYSGFYWFFAKNKISNNQNLPVDSELVENINMGNDQEIIYSGKLCFSRNQVATAQSPYSAEEYIELNINENIVSGIKKGTQVGPDISNGYEGIISGEIVGNVIGVIFNYTIEGSNQKEKEEYVFEGENLVKLRYSLVEEDGILVPNKDSDLSKIVYTKQECE